MAKVIGIFGGSFNPVHNGHIMLAQYLAQYSHLDEVWLTLSPQNPLKITNSLLDDSHRLAMLKLAIEKAPLLKACEIELELPRPSYTINTLDELSRRYPNYKFNIVIGGDNWNLIDRWKDYQRIINDYGVVIYPRPGYKLSVTNKPNVVVVEAPLADISSTQIRTAIANHEETGHLLPKGVAEYINKHNLYK